MNCQTHLFRGQDPRTISRRWFLKDCGMGLGVMALGQLLGGVPHTASAAALTDPLAPKTPPLPAKAKRIIFLFMAGAPSQLDLFDYKPELVKREGQLPPAELLEN